MAGDIEEIAVIGQRIESTFGSFQILPAFFFGSGGGSEVSNRFADLFGDTPIPEAEPSLYDRGTKINGEVGQPKKCPICGMIQPLWRILLTGTRSKAYHCSNCGEKIRKTKGTQKYKVFMLAMIGGILVKKIDTNWDYYTFSLIGVFVYAIFVSLKSTKFSHIAEAEMKKMKKHLL